MSDDLHFEVMVLVIESSKLILCFFFYALQFRIGRAEICPSLDSFESLSTTKYYKVLT